jgi:hypothetical protein
MFRIATTTILTATIMFRAVPAQQIEAYDPLANYAYATPFGEEAYAPSAAEPLPEHDHRLDTLGTARLWKEYRQARSRGTTLKDSGRYAESIYTLVIAARCAEKLERPDLAAWQLNNAAKHGIDAFKAITRYGETMAEIEAMKPGKAKVEAVSEVRQRFAEYLAELDRAEEYLLEAGLLNADTSCPERTRVIASNLRFIAFIRSFIRG